MCLGAAAADAIVIFDVDFAKLLLMKSENAENLLFFLSFTVSKFTKKMFSKFFIFDLKSQNHSAMNF